MKIVIKNNLRLSQIPEDLQKNLKERLQFPNPKWVENHRMGRWNRGVPKVLKFYHKIRGNGLWIPRGYLRQLILLCRNMNIAYDIEDQRRSLPEISFTFEGGLRSFQQKAVGVMLQKEFGTLSSPTGSGKTVMALYMAAMRKQPVMIVVHTKDLAAQWMERTTEFLNIPKNAIGLIGSGRKQMGEHVTIAMVQSLYKSVDEVMQHIGFLIVDECHRCPSRTFTEAVEGFDARYMLGLSATPWRRDNLSKLIFWYLGDLHYEVGKSQLVESGNILKAKIITRETNFKPFHDPVTEYSQMLSELTADDERNRLIADDIANETKNGEGICLVLSDRKKHCEMLAAILTYKHHIALRIFTGDLSTNERRKILDEMQAGRFNVLIATGQLMGEGFDNKHLSTLFLTTPVKFSGRILQYVGRVLRPAPGKKQALIYDYVDINVDVLKASANARKKIFHTI